MLIVHKKLSQSDRFTTKLWLISFVIKRAMNLLPQMKKIKDSLKEKHTSGDIVEDLAGKEKQVGTLESLHFDKRTGANLKYGSFSVISSVIVSGVIGGILAKTTILFKNHLIVSLSVMLIL